ncbi:hypothetical protein ACIQZO_35045 [Streptomyces sp. NPDC097617]
MIHLVLLGGLVGLLFAVYAKASDLRFIGAMTALAGLLAALTDWGSW